MIHSPTLLDQSSVALLRNADATRTFYIHVRGKYIGSTMASLNEICRAFPYSEIANGSRVHLYGPPSRNA